MREGVGLLSNNLSYGLEDRPSKIISFLAGLQWMIFIISGNFAVPLIVGHVFGLTQGEIGALTQRTILLTGLASLLQILWGHRLPLIEGVAGMWWGVFIILGSTAATLGKDPRTILTQLESGLILAGILLTFLGVTGFMGWLQKLFTPLITGTYLLLLALQLSGPFLRGMLGIENNGGMVDWRIASLSLALVALVLLLSFRGRGWWKSLTPLIGIAIGWAAFIFLDLGTKADWPELGLGYDFIKIPSFFNWGLPTWDIGIIFTSLLTAVILLSNLVASINAMEGALGQSFPLNTYKWGGIFNGIANILAGIWSGIGMIPLSISAGFIGITGMAARLPFIIACLMIILVGLLPLVGQFFAQLPLAVAYAVTFVSFSQMIGYGMKNLSTAKLDQRGLTVFSLSLITGVGFMFISPDVFTQLPSIIQYIFSNGLLLGVLLALLLEHLVLPQKKEPQN